MGFSRKEYWSGDISKKTLMSASIFAGLGLKKQKNFLCEEEESLGATGEQVWWEALGAFRELKGHPCVSLP